MADVARLAAVSTATVSRVLSRPESVSDVLRKKVGRVVAQLGYLPDAGARALMLRRSGTVGAVFPTVDNAIFASAIEAFQRRLATSDMQLLLATSGYDLANEMRQAINLVTRGADGLALCGLRHRPELLDFLSQRRVPCVHLMIHHPGDDCITVGFDNTEASRQATRYLIDLGHRQIAMLAGVTNNNDRATDRVKGVRQALASVGLELTPRRLVERAYNLSEARAGLRELMAQRPAPTAIICGNDVLAFGAMLEAGSLGLEIPRDVSIVGFDDLEMARHMRPALTTIRVPTEQMWAIAADRLIAAIRGLPFPHSTKIDVALIVRESTGTVREDLRQTPEARQ